MAEDGSVRIKLDVDDSTASSKLLKLQAQAEKMRQALEKNQTKHSGMLQELEEMREMIANTEKEYIEAQSRMQKYKSIVAKGENGATDEEYEYRYNYEKSGMLAQDKTTIKQDAEWLDEYRQKYEQFLAQTNAVGNTVKQQEMAYNAQLTAIGEQAQKEVAQGAAEMDKLKASTEGAGQSASIAMPNFNKLFRTVLKYGLGIRSTYILFRKLRQAVIEGMKEMAKSDEETKQTLVDFKSALAELKGSFGAAFAPIINAVLPALTKLIEWLTKAMNAIQAFFAVLSGKTTYKRAVANTDKIEKSLSDAAGSAKELKKQLMGIDELNILQNNNGGGGSNSDFSYVDEEIDMNSLPAKLGASFSDVFFKWDNLNKEQICKKVAVGLTTAVGMAAGFTIGGIPGAAIGALAGAGIGLLFDALTFDNDGEISDRELSDMLTTVLGALVGGLIGFEFAGIPGALIGATIGTIVTMGINQLRWKKTDESRVDRSKYKDGWAWFACGVLGLPTDEEILAWCKKNLWEEGLLAFLEELLTLVTGTEYAGLTGEELVNQLHDGLSSVGEMLEGIWNDHIAPWFTFDKWRELGLTAINGIKNGLAALKIPQFHFSWDWQEYSGSFFGQTVSISIPYPHLDFYARGGIVDGATLFGNKVVGEAGKEAIVPLERHTEWIDMVADGLLDNLLSSQALNQIAQAFTETAMPAMAMGSVIPPNIASIDDSLKGISDTLNRVVDMLGSLNSSTSNGGDYRFYLDGKEISAVVSKYQRQSARANGV